MRGCGKRLSACKKSWRPRSASAVPERVDEEIPVPVPAQCPTWAGPLTLERIEAQYQKEIVPRTWVRRFDIPICRCTQCGKVCRCGSRCEPPMRSARGGAAGGTGVGGAGSADERAAGIAHADGPPFCGRALD